MTTATEQSNIPRHIAIIPDGNRRWAKEKGLPTLEGHRKGAVNFEKLLQKAEDLGVKCVSAWFFSTENWGRSKEEVSYLFDLGRGIFTRYKQKFMENGIRFVHLGRKGRLPKDVGDLISDLEQSTKDNKNFTLAIGIDYGGHDELIRTINKLIEKGLEVTVANIESLLDTAILPQIDFIIRTSGEKRLSGFMSWQCAYAELYFAPELFPDFGPVQLECAIKDFANRDRRFGGDSKK